MPGFLIFGPVLCLWVVSFKGNYLTSLIRSPPWRHFFNDDLIASYTESWRKQCCWEFWEFCFTLKNNATFFNIKLRFFFFFFQSAEINGIETSLVVQWFRLPLPMQGPRVRSWVRELRSYMAQGQKTQTWNRRNIVINSRKTLKVELAWWCSG